MNLLLDTHTFLWFSEDNPKLSETAKLLIEDLENDCFISIASLWEMAIKISLNKLRIKIKYDRLIEEINKYDFIILPISFEHTFQLTSLEFHHRDPFDRLLIAQAIVEDLTLITIDNTFDKYNVKRIC